MKKHKRHILIGFLTGILNGLFGSGGGTVVVPAMERFLGFEEKEAHASALLVILVMSVVSTFIYVRQGFFDPKLWLYTSLGGSAGGLVGAKLLARIPKKWLKIGFGAMILLGAVRMIF